MILQSLLLGVIALLAGYAVLGGWSYMVTASHIANALAQISQTEFRDRLGEQGKMYYFDLRNISRRSVLIMISAIATLASAGWTFVGIPPCYRATERDSGLR